MTTARERGRRKIVALVTLVYLLLIFEGAVRKWMAPQLGQWLFFIRDPFVLMAYALALGNGFFPRANNGFMLAGLGLGVVALVLVAAQTISQAAGASAWMLAIYGWRNYFFYIPLAFVIGEAFERPDIERIVRWTLILAVPTAILVFLQFVAPRNAPINVGFGADEALQFHGLNIDATHTRPMGFFTSDVGEKEFVVSALSMAIALWLLPAARRFVKLWFLLPATCAVLTCLAVSGSRGAVVHSGILLMGAIGCAVVLRGASSSARALIWPTVIGVAAVVAYPILFPEAAEVFMSRWTRADAVETQTFGSLGIFGRALYSFIDFFNLMGETPLVGFGLGAAGNARLILGIQIEGLTGWAETDWARHIVDLGPVVGIVFIAYRIAFTSWLGLRCLGGARRANDPLPLLLFAFVGVELLYGLMTGHGSVNGYVWLFTGFCLAVARPSFASTAAERVGEPLVPQPRFANLMR